MKIVGAKPIGWSSVVGGGVAITVEGGKKFQIAFMGVNGGITKEENEALSKLVSSALFQNFSTREEYSGWLIERGGTGGAPIEYVRTFNEWTLNASDALRFHCKENAEDVVGIFYDEVDGLRVAEHLWSDGKRMASSTREEGLKEAAKIADFWTKPNNVRLQAGEMTAQEMRTVIAVVTAIRDTIRALIPQPSPDAKSCEKRKDFAKRLADYSSAAYEAMSQGGDHRITVDPTFAEDMLGAAALALSPSSTVRGWNPIESAPKDGGDVIVYYHKRGQHVMHLAFWDAEEQSWLDADACIVSAPTHWIPLPAYPMQGDK